MTDQLTRVAVLSDTHGLLRREVVAEIQDCTHIVHAGDIIRESDLWQEGLRDLAGMLRFEIAGVHFLMTHDRRDVPRNLDGVQAVICGHTHVYREEWTDGRLWLNPGSCSRSRFGGDVTLARLELREGKILRVSKITLEG